MLASKKDENSYPTGGSFPQIGLVCQFSKLECLQFSVSSGHLSILYLAGLITCIGFLSTPIDICVYFCYSNGKSLKNILKQDSICSFRKGHAGLLWTMNGEATSLSTRLRDPLDEEAEGGGRVTIPRVYWMNGGAIHPK